LQRIAYFVVGTIVGGFIAAAALHAAQAQPRDAVEISPDYYTVRIDNDRVRVLDYHLKPGQSERMHSHLAGVAYIVSGATIRTILPDGKSVDGVLRTGDIHWRPNNIVHAVENIGTTEEHAIIMELKDRK
jgi:quercetin dioxygenase-like cupin family protein